MDRITGKSTPIEQLYQRLDTTGTSTAVSVILKLRGETCDIDCLYCYEKRKEAPGGTRVDAEHVRRLTELFRGRPLAIELHGGEPLTAGQGYMADVLAELAVQPAVLRVSLQTNGLQLDNSWLDLFDTVYPDLRIGISLDGDPEGNAWRVGYDGAPTYPRVARALCLLGQRGRKVGVITAVTPRALGRAEAVLDHLAGFDALNAISFVPCFDATVTRITPSPGRRVSISRLLQQAHVSRCDGPAWAITPAEYVEFVLSAGIHWVTSGLYARLSLEPLVSTIRRLRGLDTAFCHFSNLKCDHVFTLYPDGRFGSCDELPWPAAQLAELAEVRRPQDVVSAQRHSVLLGQGRSLVAKCVTCDYRGTCGGGCIATRWRYAAAGDEDAYCDYRMRLIDGVAGLLAQPAAPAGVWCRQVRWRPRDPNSMHDVVGFLSRWDDPTAFRPAARLRTSLYGNINTVGEPGVHEADDLDPAHPRWLDAIEPGVWPLVEACTVAWGRVTYDSCQGHDVTGPDVTLATRRVGILPRDADEYVTTASALCRAVTEVAGKLPAPVRTTIGRAELTCETSGRRIPVLDLCLEPNPGHDWGAYFRALDEATATLAASLRRNQPDNCACSCPSPELGALRRTEDVQEG